MLLTRADMHRAGRCLVEATPLGMTRRLSRVPCTTQTVPRTTQVYHVPRRCTTYHAGAPCATQFVPRGTQMCHLAQIHVCLMLPQEDFYSHSVSIVHVCSKANAMC